MNGDMSDTLGTSAELALRQSEERFRQFVQGAKDYAIVMLDLNGRIVSWNTGAQLINGYLEDEIVGEHIARFYSDEDVAAQIPARDLAVAKREGRMEQEGWRRRKDGELFWANVVITRLADTDGVARVYSQVTRDITERKNAETQLLESEARTRAILAAAVDAIIIIDAKGGIESLNPAAEKLFGYSAEELAGRNVKMLMPKPYQGE